MPEPWADDGGLRREPVLDHDYAPPRVVRFVGWARCLRCRRPFFSEDVVRLRMCTGAVGGCRESDERFADGLTGGNYSGDRRAGG
ncbi:hypothetical protein GVO57_10485 [Sphingomonas changnyeongensis]|uniref:Uncharacterized protein n=1 Tax=Sphingomonas changnyeongensis TaxID=2698679 RepID=A0A7Z2NXB9_9SPHN|nr:hypothetical protein [Sphingomonas changnyeongensis]QHL91166.1 hypothetical protein GVO57_10485 [Sphingomonas changnyeongensis]